MIKIGVLGAGGVGGYLSAVLCQAHEDNPDVNISLFLTSRSAKVITERGLTIKSINREDITTYPRNIYTQDNCRESVDYLFVCVKSYSTPEVISWIREITTPNSVIIPLQNGFDGYSLLKSAFPDRAVAYGCIYIISEIESPGVVIEKGGGAPPRIYYGFPNGENSSLSGLDTIMASSSDSFMLDNDIEHRIWLKFMRISTVSTILTYHNISCGEILENPLYIKQFKALTSEFAEVARLEGVFFEPEILEHNFDLLADTPYDMTTSMQRDYINGKMSELECQTGYIVKKGTEHGLSVCTYKMMYERLKKWITL